MFALFHKKGQMIKECMKGENKISVAALTIVTLLILLLTEIVTGFILVFVLGFQDGGEQSLETMLNSSSDASQLISLFLTSITIIGFLIAGKYLFKRSWLSLGLTRKNLVKDYVKGLGIGFVMMAGAVGIAYLMNGLRFDGFQNFSVIVLIAYFIGFMIQGFNEELMVRGFFMNAVAARKSTVFAVLFNSILFAALHLANDGITILSFINLVLAGITFSLMALYHDNITVCSAAHSIWNFAQGNLFGVLVSGIYLPTTLTKFIGVENHELINGGSFGLEGGIAVMLVELIGIGVYCYLYARKQKPKKMLTTDL